MKKWGKARFPAPEVVEEIVELLNGGPGFTPNLTLWSQIDGSITLITGDQPLYEAKDQDDLKSFLLGMFNTTWGGRNLDEVRTEAATNLAQYLAARQECEVFNLLNLNEKTEEMGDRRPQVGPS